jgi:excisionase family DNA binding protein
VLATLEAPTRQVAADDDPFLDTEAAAAIPAVHPQTIRKAFREGRLKGIKVNGSRVLRFRRSWVVAWLEGGLA